MNTKGGLTMAWLYGPMAWGAPAVRYDRGGGIRIGMGWYKGTGKLTIGGDFSERGVCGDGGHVAFNQKEFELGRDRTT